MMHTLLFILILLIKLLFCQSDDFVLLNSLEQEKIYEAHESLVNQKDLTWDNIVIIILTYKSQHDSNLLQKHFETWIKRIPTHGLDIMIISDGDDERSISEIIPDVEVEPTIHLYKTGPNMEGAQARNKTVEAMTYTYNTFKERDEKKFFLKIDTDTFVIPENLLSTLKEVYKTTDPLPANFGKADCVLPNYRNCFSLGGTYGMSKSGLKSTVEYIIQHEYLLTERRLHRMLDEDVFMSNMYHRATKFPIIHVSGVSINYKPVMWKFKGPHEETWEFTKHHITIHRVKDPNDFDMLNSYYYDEDGNLFEKFIE